MTDPVDQEVWDAGRRRGFLFCMSGPCRDSCREGVTMQEDSAMTQHPPPSLSETTMEPHKATVVQGTGHREEWGNQDAEKTNKFTCPSLPQDPNKGMEGVT